MTVEIPPAAAPEAPASANALPPASFDERWVAWQAKGAVHDRAVRRRMVVAAPVVIALAAAIIYALSGR